MWTERRLGRFELSEELLMPPTDHLWLTMRDVVILYATWVPARGVVTYLGWSPRFRELEEGEEAPLYMPRIVSTKGSVKMSEWTEAATTAAASPEGGRRARTKA